MPTGFYLSPVKFISGRRRVECRCAGGNLHDPLEDPVKEEAQFYEDCVRSVQLEYGKNSKVLREFERLHKHGKEQRITVENIEYGVQLLLKDHPELISKFYRTVLPYLYPLATEDEVDRANQFIETVKSAFPDNKRLCYAVKLLILKFQNGKLTFKEMTVEMLKLLENRVELVEAYIKFVPQAQNIRNRGIFFSYPVIAGILVAFAIGLWKMKQ